MATDAQQAFTPDGLRAAGFTGFVTFAELLDGEFATVPTSADVYGVIRTSEDPPVYREKSVGGWFKGRDPSVAEAVLAAKWIEDCQVVYIGKADQLRRRLRQRARFGVGEPVGAWGGRYIWQLADSDELTVAWRACPEGVAAHEAESQLLREFRTVFGRLPFANIVSPDA